MEQRDANGLTEQEFLQRYDPGDYPRPSIATDMVIFTVGETAENNYRKLAEKELRLLLIRRGGHPFLGKWALPGGFMRPGETVGQTARRELLEETGVGSGYLEQLYTFSEPGRDPRSWIVSCAHMALVDSSGLQLRPGDDASDARWFRLRYTLLEETRSASPQDSSCMRLYQIELQADETLLTAKVAELCGRDSLEFEIIENDGLAFDHAKIIACAVRRLRGKLDYTDLALNLMPPTFTLTELQQVYEVILGKPLLKAAFRRKIKDLVCETGEYTEHAGHRPSQLYRRYWEEEAR